MMRKVLTFFGDHRCEYLKVLSINYYSSIFFPSRRYLLLLIYAARQAELPCKHTATETGGMQGKGRLVLPIGSTVKGQG